MQEAWPFTKICLSCFTIHLTSTVRFFEGSNCWQTLSFVALFTLVPWLPYFNGAMTTLLNLFSSRYCQILPNLNDLTLSIKLTLASGIFDAKKKQQTCQQYRKPCWTGKSAIRCEQSLSAICTTHTVYSQWQVSSIWQYYCVQYRWIFWSHFNYQLCLTGAIDGGWCLCFLRQETDVIH